MQIIEEIAQEGSSFFPTIYFWDEEGVAMTPATLYWALTDLQGNVINSRNAVSVVSPSTSLTLALGSADLVVLGNDIASRLITTYGTYTSGTHGAGQPFLFQAKFSIQSRIGKRS